MSSDEKINSNNLPTLAQEKSLAVASKQLAITNKSLQTIGREKFIRFLVKNQQVARIFINVISRFSPVFSTELIDRYAVRWDWSLLSSNEALPWSEAFIESHADRWHWRGLSWNEALPWSEAFIVRHADRWNFKNIRLINEYDGRRAH